MAGILHSISVSFHALMGGFTGPLTAARASLTSFGTGVAGAVRNAAQLGQRIEATGARIQQLQRHLADSGRNMSEAERAALRQRLRGLQEQHSAMLQQQQAMQRLGQTAQVAGAAMVVGFGLAVKAAADFDKAMSKVAAVSNASAAELDALRKSALQAGKETKFSATEAAKAQGELVKAGISTADVLGGALTGTLALAAAGEMELADAAIVAAQSMNIFKLQGKDVGHIADVLAAGANKSAADVKGLAWSMRMGGQVAAQTGLTLEDTVGVLSAFADNALIGSDAGTSLKTMLQHLANPSEKSANLMAELGIEVYNTNGNFVGMAQLAQNLQRALGGLTQAQRDQAMAQIFGSDAVRGANVLYKIGSEGVADYTKAVNDNGAATRMAAMMTDNLAGDLERLKGSIETALIQSGSGANSVMRELVQGVNAAVGAFLALPNSVQSGTVMIIGMTGAVILLTKAMIFMVTTAKDARLALLAMGVTQTQITAAMTAIRTALATTASFLMGPWGIALAAGVAILAIWQSKKKSAAKATEEFTAAIKADSGAMGENTRQAIANALEKEGLLETAKRLGIDLNLMTDAVMGNSDAMNSVGQAVEAYRDKLKKMREDGKLTHQEWSRADLTLNEFEATIKNQSGSLVKSAEAAKRVEDATKRSSDRVSEATKTTTTNTEATNSNAAAQDGLGRSTDGATQAVSQHMEAETGLIEIMRDATRTAEDLKAAFDELSEANMNLDLAMINQREEYAQTIKAKDNHAGISDKERKALISLGQENHKLLVQMKESGVQGDEIVQKQAKLEAQFIKVALAMGVSETEARELADRYGQLGNSAEATQIRMSDFIGRVNEAAGAASRMAYRTTGAKDANNVYRKSIQDSLPVLYALAGNNQKARAQVDLLANSAGVVARKMDISRDAFYNAARAMGLSEKRAGELWSVLKKMRDVDVDVTVSATGSWAATANRKFDDSLGFGRAKGGPIPDIPGASRDYDSVPAMLRVDEHVWTPEEVDAAGGHGAMYRLRRAALRGDLRGFAKGGPVLFSRGEPISGVMAPISAGYTAMIEDVIRVFADAWKKIASGGSVVSAARSMIGYPYSWGGGGKGGPSYGIERGANTFGFDCSGLTEYAWWKGRRVSIGGWTGDQIAGSRVISGPRPGALGFPHPGHVVLYSGNNRVIQAPQTGSFVNEGPISRSYTWRWPNNAGYAKGGPVGQAEWEAGQEYLRTGRGPARVFGLAGDPGPGKIRGYGSGGWITGRAGRDNLLLAASAGEFMVNAQQSRRYAPMLEAINSGQTVSGTVVINLYNHGVIASQAEADRWLANSMERLRRQGKLN